MTSTVLDTRKRTARKVSAARRGEAPAALIAARLRFCQSTTALAPRLIFRKSV
jgi:hypothetical protein